MLSLMRRFLDTWAAKLFFFVLVGAFGLWGVADMIRGMGTAGAVAVVGDRKIELPEVQEAYRRQLAQVTRMFGAQTQPTLEIKRAVAGQALEQLVTLAALDNEVSALRLGVTDAAVIAALQGITAFNGPKGTFDRATYEQVLRNNGYTPKRFETMMRSDLGQRQLLETVRAGAASPEALTKPVYGFQRETRLADAVDVAFASTTAPEPATDAQLERYYDNNKSRYSTVELRRVRAVILAPETVAADIQITPDEIKAAYEQRRDSFVTPDKRSVQVILAQDEATAAKLAAAWNTGLDWTAIQKQASESGAAGVELNDATEVEFPAPELGAAVFATPQGVIPPPVRSALGWHVLKITAVSKGSARSLADVTPELRARVLADKAVDVMYTRARQIEDLLAAGTTLEALPGDLGLAPIVGTLDAKGTTKDGQPAPVPGPAELRPALIQAAFQAKIGDAPHLVQAPNAADGTQSFFAFSVEEITAPQPRPFSEVTEMVRADWLRDATRRAAETEAAAVLAKVKEGSSLADAASAVALQVRALPATSRSSAPDGVPTQLITPLFGLKLGEPTMVETPDGFVVAVLVAINEADPAADPAGFAQLRDQLAKAMADDTEALFGTALRDRAKPSLNRAQLNSLVQGE